MKHYKLPNLQTKAETIVLANGEFPTHPIAISLLENGEYIVCCDGATNQLVEKTDRLPDAIVGDLDSLTEENRTRFSRIVHHVGEQETNDLTKSVKYSLAQHRKRITILGATGKREDHTIGNISLLAEYLDLVNLDVEMVTNYGVFTAIDQDSEFESFQGQQVSIFNIENVKLTSLNLAYPITDRIFTNWWQGTLNESLSNSFKLKTSGKVIVFRAF
ncbi:thiamine diphosphokinase [Dysgonomonas sp. 520]|uniref:thiamine diphosphokinase n=1 Tax=Dysgonomonas sp. 520 TaxID=2302931 RepID=UPI0013D1A753|nr:thiamine diphosphokinase [Dysgonomonas sp. 520]NDW09051.1 thiamine diphosphokinase [Dysgonomonas sp. 520]